MNQRSSEILQLLAERSHSSIEELAELHAVSQRTIRNDIASLNLELGDLGLGQVRIQSKKVSLELDVDKQRFLDEIFTFDAYKYKFSSEERSLICLLLLITEKDYVTLNQLSEKLLASRSTIVNDVKVMRDLAKKNNLEVISRANKGYKIRASEEAIRNFLFQIVNMDNFSILEGLVFEEDYIKKIHFSVLQNAVEVKKSLMGLTERQNQELLSYLLISSYRNYKGFWLENKSGERPHPLKELKASLEDRSYLYLVEEDFKFISQQVFVEHQNKNIETSLNKETLRIQVTAMKFIEAISSELRIDFKDDYLFYENFSAHLVRMMRKIEHRSSKSLDISNVVETNPKIKRVILKYLWIIEENIGRSATHLEVDYIIIYVYAAMERKKRSGSNLKVAVLTEKKATEVFYIESKLVSNFSFSLDIYSIEDQLRGDYDLILTTTPLPNQSYIHISPFISEEDYILIANHVHRIVNEKKNHQFKLERNVALKLYQLISEEIEQYPETPPQLKTKIRDLIFTNIEQEKEESPDQALYEFLTPERIELDIEVRDWRDSIYQAGKTLIEMQDITEDYLDLVIENIVEQGPYVVISKGFAFPHAQLGTYNKKTAMSLIRLKEPVYFDDEERDNEEDIATLPVKYVCILSTTDRKKHLKAIFNLFNLLKDPGFKIALDQCQTAKEMHQLIEERETLLELRR